MCLELAVGLNALKVILLHYVLLGSDFSNSIEVMEVIYAIIPIFL